MVGNSGTNADADVIIVGAGPVGLVLAIDLGRRACAPCSSDLHVFWGGDRLPDPELMVRAATGFASGRLLAAQAAVAP